MIERYIVRLYQRLKGLTTQQLRAEQARFLTHLSALSPAIHEARLFVLAFRRLLKNGCTRSSRRG